MEFNDLGLKLLKEFEGCSLVAYQDQGGKWTCGYGHTDGVKSDTVCTADEAQEWLRLDVQETCDLLRRMLASVSLNDNQFSALICLVYNIGYGNFKKSTFLNCLLSGSIDDAADQFLVWNKVAGVINPGLARRRAAEKNLYCTPV